MPALPRRLLRLLLLAASDSTFESSVGVDYAKPTKSEQEEEAFASEEDDAVEASTVVEGVTAAAAGHPTPVPPTRHRFGLTREKMEGGRTFRFPLSFYIK